MATPTILFNASTGSDTAASGAGPGTALTGTGASLNATTSADLSADSPDLSGVATDGSAALWVATTSGRQYSRITAVDNGTKIVTVATAYAVTESSRTWGIGGKRATFDHANSRTLFSDFEAQWIIETETAQSLTSVIGVNGTVAATTNLCAFIQGSSGSRKTITQTANAACFELIAATTLSIGFARLKLECSNATRTAAYGINIDDAASTNTRLIRLVDCEFGDVTNTLVNGFRAAASTDRYEVLYVSGCYCHHCTGAGGSSASSAIGGHSIVNSMFVENGSHGFSVLASSDLVILGSIFANNAGDGFRSNGPTGEVSCMISNCTFAENAGDGLEFLNAASSSLLFLANNIFANNGGYGIAGTDADWVAGSTFVNSNNCFYNNTSGTVQETDIGTGANVITTDPLFVNAAGNDFRLQPGSPCRGAAYMNDIGGAGLSSSDLDIGAVQHSDPARANYRIGI